MSRWGDSARGGVQVPLSIRAEWHLHPYPPAAGTLIEMSRRSHLPATGVMRLTRTLGAYSPHQSDGSPLMDNKTSRDSPSPRPPSAGQLSPQDLAGVV